MFPEATPPPPSVPTLPVSHHSAWSDRLIRAREWLLDSLTGANRQPALNAPTASPGAAIPLAVATQLGQALAELKSSVMIADGANVDYAALRRSPVYVAYRQERLAPLSAFDPHDLPSPAAARAFWLNLYNALVLDAVIQFGVRASVIEGWSGALAFFRRAAYQVGGQRLSLEGIEHGILRGNRGNPFLPGAHFPTTDPRLAWSLPLDPRIHFALNCGGRSCPPIRAYTPEGLEQELTLAARSFLAGTVEWRPARRELIVSQILRWYAADFGGRDGVLRFLRAYLPDDERRQALSADSDLRLRYVPYDWGLNGI